jgi:two-component system, chemotaxis family, chemotaxis protein CheY
MAVWRGQIMTDDAKTLRILIVDDDEMIRVMLSSLLNTLGVDDIVEAENGKQGISKFSAQKPDLTFLDIQMPVKNGFDTLREIMRIDTGAKVIMLTANDDTVVAESCINAGAQTYIKKGESPSLLMPVLKTHIESLIGR